MGIEIDIYPEIECSLGCDLMSEESIVGVEAFLLVPPRSQPASAAGC
jgi:hypothetical protein